MQNKLGTEISLETQQPLRFSIAEKLSGSLDHQTYSL